MSSAQLDRRTQFVEAMRASGWEQGGLNDLWEEGVSLSPEASADYRNPAMKLRASYHAADGFIGLELLGVDQAFSATLRFYVDDPSALLQLVTQNQDSLTPDTFADFVRTAIPKSRLALFETTAGLIELSL